LGRLSLWARGESGRFSAIAAYKQASQDGAVHIIGPLDIDATRTIAALPNLPTPILLLNEQHRQIAGDTRPSKLVTSLSLSSTEEAAAIALKALAQGFRSAIVMVPDSAWGIRMEGVFTAAFEQGGGSITARTRFDTSVSDHSAMLTKMLEIDASNQRKADLQSWLAVPLTFEPIRREDFEFIFLAANPVAGRELKPLLRFHDAGDVPVFSMGRIFSGRMQRASDQDLDGIVFPATRFQLEAVHGGTASADNDALVSLRGGVYDNLYALGQDAWRLLPWLPLLQKDPDLWFPGEIGALRLQLDGSFYREPAWAQFSSGRPSAYQWPQTGGE
jgi:outer membrane PBP1 activator LpoA protein